MLHNRAEQFALAFALQKLGALGVPLGFRLTGPEAAYIVDDSDAKAVVCEAGFASRLEAALGAMPKVPEDRFLVVGSDAERAGALAKALHLDDALAAGSPERFVAERPAGGSIIYTSGTTGPSKGVLSSYLQLYSMGVESLFFAGQEDRCMVNLPLFHVGGTAAVYAMLAKGGSIAVVDAFDTARFWSTVRETGTTTAILLGVMASFLAKQAPSPQDREHPLRSAIMVPLGEDAPSFSRRR
jgi:crotonobetaine/carnitine-CoA ligase